MQFKEFYHPIEKTSTTTEVLKTTSNQENELVQQIITQLKQTVTRFIQENVTRSEVELSKADQYKPYIQALSENVSINLRPMVLGEVNNKLR